MTQLRFQLILLCALIISTSVMAEDGIIVHIQCTSKKSVGSGVIVSAEGHVLTAKHVLPNGSSCTASIGSTEGERFELTLLRIADNYDAALYKIEAERAFPRYATVCPLEKQREIRTAGFHSLMTGPPARKDGIVSTVKIENGAVQITAPVISGESGGPVFLKGTSSLVGIIKGADFDTMGLPVRHMVPAFVLTAFDLVQDADCSPKEQAVTVEIRELINDLRSDLAKRASAAGVTEKALIFLAQRISNDTSTINQALIELENAVEIAISVQKRGADPGQTVPFVQTVLKKVADLAGEGRHEAASVVVNEAIAKLAIAESDIKKAKIELLKAGIDSDLLRRDVQSAAVRIVQRLMLNIEDQSTLFDALRNEQDVWYLRGNSKGINLELEVAIELAKITVRHSDDEYEQGTAYNDLGLALVALGNRTGNLVLLNEAVNSYRDALIVWDDHPRPLNWTVVQNNLGIALVGIGHLSSGTKQLEIAAEAVHASLEEIDPKRTPDLWAKAQNNYANSLVRISERSTETRLLWQAIQAYGATFDIWSRRNAPYKWAAVQNNLGVALKLLGDQNREPKILKLAVKAFKAALEERSQEHVPLDWANSQNNLGTALLSLGERESSLELLEMASEAFQESLKERSRNRVPLQWAASQNNVGTVLSVLGERKGGTELLEMAVAAFQESLKERTRDGTPFAWAQTQSNLAAVLTLWGERELGTKHLEAAVQLLRVVTAEQAKVSHPSNHAAAQNNLGAVLTTFGERTNDIAKLEMAVGVLQAALEERTQAHAPFEWAATQNNLGNALARLGENESGLENLNLAVTAYRYSLQERTRARVPLDWAAVQHNLGRALHSLGRKEDDINRIREALAAFQLSLEERTREQVPLHWGRTLRRLALAKILLFQKTDIEDHIKSARDDLVRAREVFVELGLTLDIVRIDQSIREIKSIKGAFD